MAHLVRYGLCCGPLFQGEQAEEDCDGVARCGDHAGAADAASRDGSSSEEDYSFSALALFGTSESCVTGATVRPPIADIGDSRHAIVCCEL
jgi:hypothetical protein